MKVFEIGDNIFGTQPVVVCNCSYDELTKYLKKKFDIVLERDEEDEIDVSGQQFSLKDKKNHCALKIVYVKKLDKKPENLAVLVHELFHLVVSVLDDKGVPIKRDFEGEIGDETAAYLLESYFKQCLENLNS